MPEKKNDRSRWIIRLHLRKSLILNVIRSSLYVVERQIILSALLFVGGYLCAEICDTVRRCSGGFATGFLFCGAPLFAFPVFFFRLCVYLGFPLLKIGFIYPLLLQISFHAYNGIYALRIESSQSSGFHTNGLRVVASHQEDFFRAMLASMRAHAFHCHFLSCKIPGICQQRVYLQSRVAGLFCYSRFSRSVFLFVAT